MQIVRRQLLVQTITLVLQKQIPEPQVVIRVAIHKVEETITKGLHQHHHTQRQATIRVARQVVVRRAVGLVEVLQAVVAKVALRVVADKRRNYILF